MIGRLPTETRQQLDAMLSCANRLRQSGAKISREITTVENGLLADGCSVITSQLLKLSEAGPLRSDRIRPKSAGTPSPRAANGRNVSSTVARNQSQEVCTVDRASADVETRRRRLDGDAS